MLVLNEERSHGREFFDVQKPRKRNERFTEVEETTFHPRMSKLTIVVVEMQMPLTKRDISRLPRALRSKFKKLWCAKQLRLSSSWQP
jgi:hypothetical protein